MRSSGAKGCAEGMQQRRARRERGSMSSPSPLPWGFATLLGVAALAALGAAMLAHPSVATAAEVTPSVLRVSGIPDETPDERQRRFEPLGRFLETRVGIKVEYVMAPDYLALVEGFGAGKVDLAWVTGFYFLQCKAQANGNVQPLVQREEDERFRSTFVTRADSGIGRLEDLRGRDIVFGAMTSATGHLVPRWYLMQAGVDPRTDLQFFYSGAHEATVNHVASGRAVAGVLNSATWKRLVDAGQVDTTRVKAFFETGRFNDYLWAVRADLDPTLIERLRAAFMALGPKRPDDAKILALQRATRYIEVRESFYEPHAEAARAAGLLK